VSEQSYSVPLAEPVPDVDETEDGPGGLQPAPGPVPIPGPFPPIPKFCTVPLPDGCYRLT